MDPHHTRDDRRFDEHGDVHAPDQVSQSAVTPIRGAYHATRYSPRFWFNGKDFASVAATTVAMQPLILGLAIWGGSHQGDGLYGAGPGIFSAAFVMKWLWQTVAVALLKAATCFLRHYGASIARDLAAWLWSQALKATWGMVTDSMSGWFPWFRRRRRRPEPSRDDDWDDADPPWRPIRDWWDRRRRER